MTTRIHKTDAARRPYRLSVDQIERMIEAGILADGDDVELVDGILYKMVKKEPHNFAVSQLALALRRLLPEAFHVREEKSLLLGKRGLPEPDVVVAPGRSTEFRPQPPAVSEVPLIAEVCHHTQKADYTAKYRRYAAAGVPVYWVVDLHLRRVDVFDRPTGTLAAARYARRLSYATGEVVPVVIRGQAIGAVPVADLLPPGTPS
jgi:Uma2 family endonuclease